MLRAPALPRPPGERGAACPHARREGDHPQSEPQLHAHVHRRSRLQETHHGEERDKERAPGHTLLVAGGGQACLGRSNGARGARRPDPRTDVRAFVVVAGP